MFETDLDFSNASINSDDVFSIEPSELFYSDQFISDLSVAEDIFLETHDICQQLTSDDAKEIKCLFCDASFDSIFLLEQHDCDTSTVINTNDTLVTVATPKEKTEAVKKFVCEVCNREFQRRSNLNIHKRVHNGEKPFQCEICSKSFADVTNLSVHKRIHEGVKPYKCETCGKSFSQMGNLKVHSQIHIGDKFYTCKVCKKAYTRLNHLKAHEAVHKCERPFMCNVCFKFFTQINSLNIHKRSHQVRPQQNYLNYPKVIGVP